MSRDTPETPPAWEQLRSWLAVVEAGSVSAAAQRLGVAQATVSQHIRQLETLYTTELLDRSTRPARTTVSGQRLTEHAGRLLQLANEMSEGMRHFSRAKRPIARIGCVDSFAATIGPHLVRALSGRMHKVRLLSGLSPALIHQFQNNQLDVVVATGDMANEALVNRRELLSEQFVVILPPDQVPERLGTLSDIAQELQFMHYSARSVIGLSIARYLRVTDPGIERSFEFDATDPLLALVGAGLGFAITTPLCLWQSRHLAQGVKVLPLRAFQRGGKPYPVFSRSLYMAYREGELGSLPEVIQDIVAVAARDLKRQIVNTLKLDDQVLSIARDQP